MSIQQLPKDVVDRIAAGEVVQRPCSVVKEILENSLDAKSTHVEIKVEGNGYHKMSVSDNGCGMDPVDLGLAATRFATSKLRRVEDLESLDSFGFRGEALSSIALVSRLSICTRSNTQSMGHVQEYDPTHSGNPVHAKPKLQARTVGTTVVVKDLFVNMPHRRLTKARDEYLRILKMVQSYAIHVAHQGISLSCSSSTTTKNQTVVDLNTSKLVDCSSDTTTTTTRVLQHVFGSQYQFIPFTSRQVGSNNDESCCFEARGFLSQSSSSTKKNNSKSTLILFINDRLVECFPSLKRSLNDINGIIMYLSIKVPPNHVDPNVHPTKNQVALLYQDEILHHIQQDLHTLLHEQDQSFHTGSGSVVDKSSNESNKNKRKASSSSEATPSWSSSAAPPSKASRSITASTTLPRPNLLVRTTRAAPAGALEPYLQVKTTMTQQTQQRHEHLPTCPMTTVDTMQPGAFATIALCTCSMVNTQQLKIIRPKRPPTSACSYVSIQKLRKVFSRKQSKFPHVLTLIQHALFVGQVSPQQVLVQVGIELWMWNVRNLAEILFYQLALIQFASLPKGILAAPVDITKCMAYALELEEQPSQSSHDDHRDSVAIEIGETNYEMAHQATTCLLEHAEMLEEYFSIVLEKSDDDDKVYLKAMPILLNGYEPSPGGLVVFLLRLATNVDWTEETRCFHAISRELGSYYAQTSATTTTSTDTTTKSSSIQHTLFPAISSLLLPTKQVEASMQKLTILPKLYKAFER